MPAFTFGLAVGLALTPAQSATNPSDTSISRYTNVRVLSRSDEDRLRVALQHARRGKWSAAKSTTRQIKDAEAGKIVTWIYFVGQRQRRALR